MITFIITIHVAVCALLIFIILIQAGRGGGLVEGFSGVESMFGPKTNTFLTRTTTILSILFFLTCLSLALLSAKQSRSLMKDIKVQTKEIPAQKDFTESGLPTLAETPRDKVEAVPVQEMPRSELPIQQASQGEIPKTEEK